MIMKQLNINYYNKDIKLQEGYILHDIKFIAIVVEVIQHISQSVGFTLDPSYVILSWFTYV
jgi:hypothetical protein